MEDCIFCKIINREIPADVVYEDAYAMAFMDIAPVNPGHILVIPKNHSRDILDMDDDSVAHVAKLAKRMGRIMKETVKADGFNIGVNNGAASGQEVFHSHWHVIPRYDSDNLARWQRGEPYGEGEKAEMAERLRTTMKNHFGENLEAINVFGGRPYPTSDAIIVNEEGKVLLAQRGRVPFMNLWGFPGGKMDYGETIEQTCVREVKEETGLDIAIDELFTIESDIDRYECEGKLHAMNVNYICHVVGGELQTNDESLDYKWIGPDEVPDEMCFDHRDVILKYFESKK